MKVIAINCSPRKSKGNFTLILDPFLRGVHDAGAEVELLNAAALNIRQCRGKLECWFKTPGTCCLDDDMQPILDRFRKADVWVFATGVYWDGGTSLMRKIMDRMLPLVEPIMQVRQGRCHQPLRKGTMRGKVVLVSSCAHWSNASFKPLVSEIKSFCIRVEREFAGALLRPHIVALPHMMWLAKPTNHILEAARKAGQELVKNGKISESTLKAVSAELMIQRTYVRHMNQVLKSRVIIASEGQDMPTDDNFRVQTKAHPFNFKGSKDNALNKKIVEAVNRMGGTGDKAETEYQESLASLRPVAKKAVPVIVRAYRALRENQYLDRWSLVHLLAELRNSASLSALDRIVSSRIPPEKSKVLHQYSTRGEEVIIRTTAIEAIKRIAEQKDRRALELLLKHSKSNVFSIKRAAIQSFLEVGGRGARKKLLKVLPKKDYHLLNIRRKNVGEIPQAVIFDQTEKLESPPKTPPPRAGARRRTLSTDKDDAPKPKIKESGDSPSTD